MTTRETLIRLIDQLPEGDLDIVEAFVEFLQQRVRSYDSMRRGLRTAPEDDESSSVEEDLSAAEAWAEYLRGDFVPMR